MSSLPSDIGISKELEVKILKQQLVALEEAFLYLCKFVSKELRDNAMSIVKKNVGVE